MIGWVQKNLYLAIAIGLLVAAVAVLFGVSQHQSQKLGGLKESNKTLKHDVDVKIAIIRNQEIANELLRVANTKMLEEIRVSKGLYESAVGALQNELKAAQVVAATTRRIRDAEYKRTPECRSIAEIDLAAACPAVAASLRERASRLSAPR